MPSSSWATGPFVPLVRFELTLYRSLTYCHLPVGLQGRVFLVPPVGFEPTLDRSLSPLPLPVGLRGHCGCGRIRTYKAHLGDVVLRRGLCPWFPFAAHIHLYPQWDSNPHCMVSETIASSRWATRAYFELLTGFEPVLELYKGPVLSR